MKQWILKKLGLDVIVAEYKQKWRDISTVQDQLFEMQKEIDVLKRKLSDEMVLRRNATTKLKNEIEKDWVGDEIKKADLKALEDMESQPLLQDIDDQPLVEGHDVKF